MRNSNTAPDIFPQNASEIGGVVVDLHRHSAFPRPKADRVIVSRPRRSLSQSTADSDAGVLYAVFKRIFDVGGSVALLVGCLPILATVAILVKLSSKGPILYKQERVTKGGKIFVMCKFRTMTCDAEKASGAVWAQQNDPRVTFLGKILRKTRLDELPQLVNVLKGEMSLIGPRPERPEFVHELSRRLPGFAKRLQVKAGITGLAQIQSGYASSLESYRRKLAWDIVYIKHRSVLLELKIAAKTVIVVLTGSGAR